MKKGHTECDPILLGRFLDQELGPDQHARVEKHLRYCLSCQKAARNQHALADLLNTKVGKAVSLTDFDHLERQVLALVRDRQAPWWQEAVSLIFSRKILIPAATMAAVLTLFFSYPRPPAQISGPSAIINSFTGDISSVMILETPRSRQTIIWFDETF
ncbi:MAG: hypothetical protein B6245_10955 [Desulfobacteraceae bacterium 4572_88]|nr:MAG: hypothetical protein B6245_10955 [Desulfobacteraceae bacterium 4572_88]RLC20185.1 MAG: hypothetical protein DRI57_05385 [Deltaproteobacteria bacterium]